MTILAIAGSLRRGSFNRRLLEAAAALAPVGIEISIHDGLGDLPAFDQDRELAAGDDGAVSRLRAQVRAADALLIATPEYNRSFPGVLKNAIDWLSRPPHVLAGKPVAVIGVTTGRWGTRLAQSALRQVLHATDARVVPGPELFVSDAVTWFDGRGLPVDPDAGDTLVAIVSALANERPG